MKKGLLVKRVFLATIALTSLAAPSANAWDLFGSSDRKVAPLKVSVVPSDVCTSDICIPVFSWTLTSLEDGLVLKSFSFNRGRCNIGTPSGGKDENRKLDYSDTWSFTSSTDKFYKRCQPLEAKVVTNKGEYSFSID